MSYEVSRTTTTELPARASESVAAIAVALRRAARQSRVPVSVVSGGGGFRARRVDRIVIRIVAAAFMVLFALPSVVSAVYYFAIAADLYESEVRFVVRSNDDGSFDSLGVLSSLAEFGQLKDAYVIKKYIEDGGILSGLGGVVDLREIYASRPEADFFSRLNADATAEELKEYWSDRVSAEVDTRSGSVDVKVYAYRPDDALAVSKAVVDLSERMANDLTNRARVEALESARRELERSQAKLSEVTAAFQVARNDLGILDADSEAEATLALAGEIRSKLISARQALDLTVGTLDDDAPTVRILRAQIASLERQLRELQASVGRAEGPSVTLADAKRRFDQIAIEQKVAREVYVASFAKYEAARAKLEATQLYLDVFLEPTLPETPLYPRRVLAWAAIACTGLFLWGSVFGITILVRDHWAR